MTASRINKRQPVSVSRQRGETSMTTRTELANQLLEKSRSGATGAEVFEAMLDIAAKYGGEMLDAVMTLINGELSERIRKEESDLAEMRKAKTVFDGLPDGLTLGEAA